MAQEEFENCTDIYNVTAIFLKKRIQVTQNLKHTHTDRYRVSETKIRLNSLTPEGVNVVMFELGVNKIITTLTVPSKFYE